MTILRLFAIVALVLAPLTATAQTSVPGSLAEMQLGFSPVVRKAAPAVVNIYAKRVVETSASPFANDPFFSQFFGQLEMRPRVQNSLGSGVILSDSGIVVSNYHVVGGATDIRVVLNDRREFDGEVILADKRADLAVIQLRDAANLPTLELGDSDAIEVGDLVLAIGNPFGVGQTVTSGIISGLARSGGALQRGVGYFIQTDAAINPGNSGGALVDMQGRLLGVPTTIVTRSGGSNGIGFAIPANLVAQYVAQAKAGAREFARPWAGVTVQGVSGPIAEAMGMDIPRGVIVNDLHPLSPYKAAGLEAGDVILAINGEAVDAPAELRFRMLTVGLGVEARIDYLREGKPIKAEVAMIPAPDEPPAQEVTVEVRSILQGLSIASINPVIMERFGLPVSAKGVIVTGVSGPSVRAGLQPGDLILSLNRQAIDSTQGMIDILDQRPRRVRIEVQRGRKRAVLSLGN
ncbi:MAG: Do family serine endopeptidase [Brevirhabdus sp.]